MSEKAVNPQFAGSFKVVQNWPIEIDDPLSKLRAP